MTTQGIWDDIEFELIQGLPSRDELGQSIRAVQRHQNTVRAHVFGEGSRLDQREIVARQFQINEMLLTLLQETATALRKVQLDVERIARARHDGLPFTPPATSAAAGDQTIQDVARSSAAGGHDDGCPGALTAIEVAMRAETVEVPPVRGRQVGVPLVGSTITRVKGAFHRLVHFYIRLLSERQAAVNRTYGEWILYQVRLGERQRDQLVRFGRRLTALEARRASLDSPPRPE